jgi:hypothetical protein
MYVIVYAFYAASIISEDRTTPVPFFLALMTLRDHLCNLHTDYSSQNPKLGIGETKYFFWDQKYNLCFGKNLTGLPPPEVNIMDMNFS